MDIDMFGAATHSRAIYAPNVKLFAAHARVGFIQFSSKFDCIDVHSPDLTQPKSAWSGVGSSSCKQQAICHAILVLALQKPPSRGKKTASSSIAELTQFPREVCLVKRRVPVPVNINLKPLDNVRPFFSYCFPYTGFRYVPSAPCIICIISKGPPWIAMLFLEHSVYGVANEVNGRVLKSSGYFPGLFLASDH